MGEDPPASTPRVRWWERPSLWLAIMVAAFFSLSLYAGVVGYYDFQLDNPTDAGIVTQAVASTAHGGVPQFFESFDCLVKNRCSFLLVHPAFILYAVVPAFDIAPSALTLFAIRAAIVACAAIPLYWLTRQLTGSSRWALVAAGCYLVWAPTSTDDFSLHMESFLPLEILFIVALWQAGHYRIGTAVAVVTFATIEVGPVLTFAVGLFFLVPPIARFLRESLHDWRERSKLGLWLRWELARARAAMRAGLRNRPIRYTLGLMGASVAAYVFLYSFMNVWGSHVLAAVPPPTGTGVAGFFYNSSTPPLGTFSEILTSRQTLTTGEYWLLLYGLLAFIPLLSPRALVLSVPWIGWTFLSDSSRFTTLGHQYSFIAAGPVFVGFAYGLQNVLERRRSTDDGSSRAVVGRGPRARPRWRKARATAYVGAIAAIVIANALLSPVDPALAALGLHPGGPIPGDYFDHSLQIAPGFASTVSMLELIPHNATVAVPPALYALLATRPGVYILRPRDQGSTNLLPFNVSLGPTYALLYPDFIDQYGPKYWANFSDPAMYGLRAYVSSTSLGSLLLYGRDFTAPAVAFGPALAPVNASWTPGDGLTAGPIAVQSPNVSSPSGRVIQTDLASHLTGLVWTGSTSILAPGRYSIHVEVALTGVNGTVRPQTTIALLRGAGFGVTVFDDNVTLSNLTQGSWSDLSVEANLSEPAPLFTVTGELRDPDCSIAVAAVTVTYLAPD
jgi:uncharacterized membrane protein